MPWDAPVADPVGGDRRRPRAEHGDTFVVRGEGTDYLFLFSPAGVRSFYELAEADASKGIADWQMLRRKLPDELFLGRRTFPHDLFARDDVVQYRDVVDRAIGMTWAELGDAGHGRRLRPHPPARPPHRPLDVGRTVRRPRTGLRRAGRRARRARRRRRVRGSGRMATVAASGKAEEYAALAVAEAIVGAALACRDADPSPPSITSSGSSTRGPTTPERAQGVARDVVLVHLGSMSNLFAALGWLLVDVLATARAPRRDPGRRPRARGALRDGVDPDRAALDHAARRRPAVHGRRRAPRVRRHPRRHDRDAPPAHQPPGRRPRGLRPCAVVTASPGPRPRAGGTRAGDHVRARRAHVPRPAVLARGDGGRADVVRRERSTRRPPARQRAPPRPRSAASPAPRRPASSPYRRR